MTLQDERPRTREEWAERTVHARRRARFSRLLTRARQDAAKDLPLTEDEWLAIADVYAGAAAEARRRAEEKSVA